MPVRPVKEGETEEEAEAEARTRAVAKMVLPTSVVAGRGIAVKSGNI